MATLYVFVTGPQDSGKSQFLYSLGDPSGFMLDESSGIEYRHFEVDESLDVYLFCAIDGSRFDKLMDIPTNDLLGHILMVDSTQPDTWGEAQVMLQNARGYALLPTLIVANKQDLPGAATAEQVGGWIGMGSMISAVGGVASDAENSRDILLQLLYTVNREIERLDALISELEKLSDKDAQGE
jgi:uncharacterized protein